MLAYDAEGGLRQTAISAATASLHDATKLAVEYGAAGTMLQRGGSDKATMTMLLNFVGNKRILRLILAISLCPSIPILTISIFSYKKIWMPLVFMVGYLSFFIVGIPVAAILWVKKNFSICLMGGGVTAVLPILLLDMLSFFSSWRLHPDQSLFGYLVVFASGVVAGALFWGIALYKTKSSEFHKAE